MAKQKGDDLRYEAVRRRAALWATGGVAAQCVYA